MKEYTIKPKDNEKLAMHVFAPSVKYRNMHPYSFLPSVCVRWSSDGFSSMRLYEKVEILGSSTLEMLNAPLSGTSGRAQVVLLTDSPIKVWSHVDNPWLIDTTVSNNVQDIMKEVIARYDMSEKETSRRFLDERTQKLNKHKRRERPRKANRT